MRVLFIGTVFASADSDAHDLPVVVTSRDSDETHGIVDEQYQKES